MDKWGKLCRVSGCLTGELVLTITPNGAQGLCRSPEFCSYEYHLIHIIIMRFCVMIVWICADCLGAWRGGVGWGWGWGWRWGGGGLVLTITPDGTLNCCLTFKFLFKQVPYYQAITSHVLCSALKTLFLCANLHYRWVPERGGANQNANRCPDFCPVAQHCCFWHTTWFCLYVLILQNLCYVCSVKITFREAEIFQMKTFIMTWLNMM